MLAADESKHKEKHYIDFETKSFLITLTGNLCAFFTVFTFFSWIRIRRKDKLVGDDEKKKEKNEIKKLKLKKERL